MSRRSELHIVFTTDRFNCSVPQPHYINDRCYGDDLAGWLAAALRRRNYTVDEPGQEDWGWYLRARTKERSYFIGVGSTRADEGILGADRGATPSRSQRTDVGEWRLIVKKRRGLWEMMTGAGGITESDELVTAILDILTTELGVQAQVEPAA